MRWAASQRPRSLNWASASNVQPLSGSGVTLSGVGRPHPSLVKTSSPPQVLLAARLGSWTIVSCCRLRLAAARGSHQDDKLAILGLGTHAMQDLQRPEGLAHVVNRNFGHSDFPLPLGPPRRGLTSPEWANLTTSGCRRGEDCAAIRSPRLPAPPWRFSARAGFRRRRCEVRSPSHPISRTVKSGYLFRSLLRQH